MVDIETLTNGLHPSIAKRVTEEYSSLPPVHESIVLNESETLYGKGISYKNYLEKNVNDLGGDATAIHNDNTDASSYCIDNSENDDEDDEDDEDK